jgi:hypothetical protein
MMQMKAFVLMRTDSDCEKPYFMYPQDSDRPIECSFCWDIEMAAPFDSIDKILEYVTANPSLVSAHYLTIARVETKKVAVRIDR